MCPQNSVLPQTSDSGRRRESTVVSPAPEESCKTLFFLVRKTLVICHMIVFWFVLNCSNCLNCLSCVVGCFKHQIKKILFNPFLFLVFLSKLLALTSTCLYCQILSLTVCHLVNESCTCHSCDTLSHLCVHSSSFCVDGVDGELSLCVLSPLCRTFLCFVIV